MKMLIIGCRGFMGIYALNYFKSVGFSMMRCDVVSDYNSSDYFQIDAAKKPLRIEIFYGFVITLYNDCLAYWAENMNWCERRFNPDGWMIDLMCKDEK